MIFKIGKQSFLPGQKKYLLKISNVLYRFSTFIPYSVEACSDWNQIMALSTVGAVLVFFTFFVMSKKWSERMSGSSQTYLFNSNYNIDPSTMVIRHFMNMRFFC